MSRRRTLIANEIPNLNFETDVVDDEAEKRRRVSERFDSAATVAHVRRFQNRSNASNESPLATTSKTPVPVVPKPSNEQLSCLYNNCVKLLNENKINAKNAFQLKLIDYMSDIVLNSEISGGVTNFQMVGCTIDAGSKIYAARVDALHQNTYQVLSGLNHQGSDEQNDNNPNEMDVNDDGNDEGEAAEKKAKAAKKRRLKNSSHIVTTENIESINHKMRDEYKDEDLYFAKKSTCIENEAIGGILLNKLHIQNDSIKMLINSDDHQYDIPDLEKVRNNLNEFNFKSMADSYASVSGELRNLKLCADLATFSFINYNDDENDDISKLVDSVHVPAEDEGLEAHRFDANNLQMSRLDMSNHIATDNIDFDDCCHDLDNDVEMEIDPITNEPKLSQQTSGLELLDDMRMNMNSISDLSTLISHTPSDYSYFNFDKLKMINLPKHLKQIAQKISMERPTENQAVVQKNAKTSRKVIPRIDFATEIHDSKLFRVTKKATYLGDRTIEKRSEKPWRLETERQFDYLVRDFFRPYFKDITAKIITDGSSNDLVENLLDNEEGFGARRASADQSINNGNNFDDDDGHLGGLDDDFGMDEIAGTDQVNNFFTQGGGEYGASQPVDIMEHGHEEVGQLNTSRFDGENLIQAPVQVNALNIEYAKTSKNIDARRLKQVIWGLLTNNDTSDKENTMVEMNESEKKSLEVNASLKAIYKQLIPPLITQRVYDDLSICIVFQMILFLANEHNLLLQNDPMGYDVQITNY